MKRETTNRIRYVLEEVVPPALRDSLMFRAAARMVWGDHIDTLAEFRRGAASLTDEEYAKLYRAHPRVHEMTDNSQACVDRIKADVIGPDILDVGCGTGYLLKAIIAGRRHDLGRVTGADFIRPDGLDVDGIEFVEAPIERLPFPDRGFDTVVCTHVIEHILDYRAAIRELRRVAARRLIIVVPQEREGLYTFNPHFNFFAYPHSFLRAMIPLPSQYACGLIGRDIYYTEERRSE